MNGLKRTFIICITIIPAMYRRHRVKHHWRPLINIFSKTLPHLFLVAVFGPQFVRHFCVFSLLPQEGHSSGRYSLALSDKKTFGASAVPPSAVVFVSLEPRQSTVVTAARAFWNAVVQSATRRGYLGKYFTHPENKPRKISLEIWFMANVVYLYRCCLVKAWDRLHETSYRMESSR